VAIKRKLIIATINSILLINIFSVVATPEVVSQSAVKFTGEYSPIVHLIIDYSGPVPRDLVVQFNIDDAGCAIRTEPPPSLVVPFIGTISKKYNVYSQGAMHHLFYLGEYDFIAPCSNLRYYILDRKTSKVLDESQIDFYDNSFSENEIKAKSVGLSNLRVIDFVTDVGRGSIGLTSMLFNFTNNNMSLNIISKKIQCGAVTTDIAQYENFKNLEIGKNEMVLNKYDWDVLINRFSNKDLFEDGQVNSECKFIIDMEIKEWEGAEIKSITREIPIKPIVQTFITRIRYRPVY